MRFLLLLTASLASAQTSPQSLYTKAVEEFRAGLVADSARTFDELVKAVPANAPDLWQRGIALYYAGRYADCRAQFELHLTVNPADVENTVWHFLCVARKDGVEKARAAMLPVGSDNRRPMREILEMFRGKLKPEDVLKAAAQSRPSGERPAATQQEQRVAGVADPRALFYAHLYVGLYAEALGDRAQALTHIRIAAQPRFALADYMHMVAQVHLRLLETR